jgi:predicted DNA-binding protein
MARPKKFDTTIHVRLDFMQSAFLKHLAQLGGITQADALRAVVEKAMQDVLDGRVPEHEGASK